jgi:hypothetical protein
MASKPLVQHSLLNYLLAVRLPFGYIPIKGQGSSRHRLNIPSKTLTSSSMKPWLFPVAALLLASCAQSTIKKTYVATTTPPPRSIYIQPFDIANAHYTGTHGASSGENLLRKAIAPMEFANDLRDELSRIAPAAVLKPGEAAPEGWLVEGEFRIVDAGSKVARAIPVWGPLGVGRSTILIHVKISDAISGETLYAFDVSGGSGTTGFRGNTGAPGVGPAYPFDFKNAAQRIRLALSQDPQRFGLRDKKGFW